MDAIDLDLDGWLPVAHLRIRHSCSSTRANQSDLWAAALAATVAETGVLGNLIRWRIPGVTRELSFGELFTQPPFVILQRGEHALVSGLVGRIWTLRRDYPQLDGPEAFKRYNRSGSARVCFAHWVARSDAGSSVTLVSEARVQAIGLQGRLGVGAVSPLVRRFGGLVGSEGLAAAVKRAERGL